MPVLVERPTGAYTSTTTQTNATKYQVDSSLQEAIGSGKVDGDVNKLVDAINTIYSYDANGTYTNLELAVDQIKQNADDIANLVSVSVPDGSITGAKLANDAVTTDKIADNAITSAKIADLEVGTSDIVNEAVTAAKLGAGAVTNAKVANNTINEAQIQNLSVTENKIGAGAVTVGKISSGGATSGQVLTADGTGNTSFQDIIMKLLQTIEVTTDVSSIEITDIDGTYDTYIVEVYNLKPTVDVQDVWLRTSSDNGVSFDSGATSYDYGSATVNNFSGTLSSNSSAGTDTKIVIGVNLSISDIRKCDIQLRIIKPSDVNWTTIEYKSTSILSNNHSFNLAGSGVRRTGNITNAIQILMSSGNIAAGTFKLYGVR